MKNYRIERDHYVSLLNKLTEVNYFVFELAKCVISAHFLVAA